MSFAFTCFKQDSNHDNQSKSFSPVLSRRLSNYGGNSCQFLTSVDCRVIFHKTQTSCYSLNLQQLIQVDWYISFWGSVTKHIAFWGSTASSNNFMQRTYRARVDCWFHSNPVFWRSASIMDYFWLLQNIPSLPQRLRYILWGRMGRTPATWHRSSQLHRPRWHWHYWLYWPQRPHQPQWPLWLWLC